MKNIKKEVPTVNETVDTSKLNKTMFNNSEANQSKPIEAMRKALDEMKAEVLNVSFVSVKDISENETLPIRVGNSYIALDKLDIQMVFEWAASKLADIAKEKAKIDHSDQVRITIKGIGTITFGRNNLVGTVTNQNIFLPIISNDYNTHCSEKDCHGCSYNKVCSPGR